MADLRVCVQADFSNGRGLKCGDGVRALTGNRCICLCFGGPPKTAKMEVGAWRPALRGQLQNPLFCHLPGFSGLGNGCICLGSRSRSNLSAWGGQALFKVAPCLIKRRAQVANFTVFENPRNGRACLCFLSFVVLLWWGAAGEGGRTKTGVSADALRQTYKNIYKLYKPLQTVIQTVSKTYTNYTNRNIYKKRY